MFWKGELFFALDFGSSIETLTKRRSIEPRRFRSPPNIRELQICNFPPTYYSARLGALRVASAAASSSLPVSLSRMSGSGGGGGGGGNKKSSLR